MDELWQQLQVHYLVVEGQLLHWLFPGKQLHEGLMMLYEENVGTMSKQITDCGVVDIYVEDLVVDNMQEICVRAKCTWAKCPWVCLCKKTSRFESWQITSFKDEPSNGN